MASKAQYFIVYSYMPVFSKKSLDLMKRFTYMLKTEGQILQ